MAFAYGAETAGVNSESSALEAISQIVLGKGTASQSVEKLAFGWRSETAHMASRLIWPLSGA